MNIKTKIVIYIILTFVFTVLIINYRPKNEQSIYEKDWFWINKTYPYKNFDIVVYGDSRIYRGISPKSFSKVFPSADVINLGYSSGGINKDALEFAIAKLGVGNQRILVLGISPFSLTETARQNKHLNQERFRSKGDILERKFIYPFLTSFEPININPYQKSNNYQMVYHNNGWVASYKITEDTTEAFEAYRKQLSETQIAELSIVELEQFIKKYSVQGVKIFGFRPPSTYTMEQIEQTYSNFNESKIKAIFTNNNAYWIDIPNRYSYHSYDGSHLHFKSAEKLSLFLANQIKQHLDD